ncbi:hypothetical protein FIV42_18165 [Persicimonas caeni]|uniref:Tetratricopeptide repeat protein n=1 Tax=Persicimonas caeni TaxID=2292766 RepID=A0A4Y6PW66_PERCE|nr:hypothetical protein [Persicimonas caeni]QDG52591.1 hypothetical protein FIV42_18165 [Persicimonas caeni]QED33813.1 hypothetical protein FRD00_18160 [Persicimonas caeni]
MRRALTITIATLLLGAGLLLGQGVAHAAPEAPTDGYDVVIKVANSAYNDGKYKEAARGFIQAIQSRPERAVPYRNLARTYFWQSQYAEAVAYYDMYLRLATDADDRKQVQSERRLASSRAGEQVWTTPEPQRQALGALEEQLEKGAAYAPGGGGAWGLYNTLLRTGFAQPELAKLRRRLVSKLLDEFEGTLVPDANQPTPRLDLDAWQLQQERLEAARQLTHDEALLAIIERRSALVGVGLALLNGQYDEVVATAGPALEKNPDMPFVRWLQITALVEEGEHEKALDAVEALAKQLAQTRPNQLGYAKILRASILQRMGRGDDAADLYLGLIEK